jgi:hypothetical protein
MKSLNIIQSHIGLKTNKANKTSWSLGLIHLTLFDETFLEYLTKESLF